MATIKHIDVLSFSVFATIIGAAIGLVLGVLYSFGGLAIDIATIGINQGTGLAFLALVGMPLIFASMGFVVGVVAAVLYNLVAKKFGLVIDLET